MPELMSSGEAARRLGVSPSLLRKLEWTGVTAPARRIGGDVRRVYTEVEVEELRQILADRRARVTQAEPIAA